MVCNFTGWVVAGSEELSNRAKSAVGKSWKFCFAADDSLLPRLPSGCRGVMMRADDHSGFIAIIG
jgi:hypothetical protein